ncbi:MAG: hypothetical protein GYB67_03860 [Chloroflexi bacterium]|nr:hypothetical protein [Chloroflexota bacterium]
MSNRRLGLILVLITGLAFTLRIIYINQPMRYDESLTFLSYASESFITAITTYREPNNHVLHTALVSVAYSVFGNEPWIIRLPAFIVGVLIVPALYLVTRRFYNAQAALLAALLAAVSLPLIEFSVNARGYTLLTLIFVILLGLAHQLKAENGRTLWLVFGIGAALGFYTIPVMVYAFGIIALWLLLSIWVEYKGVARRRRLVNFVQANVLGAVLTVLFYLPIIRNEGLEALLNNEFVSRVDTATFFGALPQIGFDLAGFPMLGIPSEITALLGIGILVSLIFHRRLTSDRIALIPVALVWLIPLLLIQQVIPFDRNWIFLAPLYFMAAAAGLVFLVGQVPFLYYLLVIVLSGLVGLNVVASEAVLTSDRTGIARDAEAIVLWLEERLTPGDRVLAPTPLDEPIRYYLDYHQIRLQPIYNQYQTFWVDLLHADTGTIYVVGAAQEDPTDFTQTFLLDRPALEMRLSPEAVFVDETVQVLTTPRFAPGTLYDSAFAPAFYEEVFTINDMDATLTTDSGQRVIELVTDDVWGEMILSGGLAWLDYAFSARVKLLNANTRFEDVYLGIRHTPRANNYSGSISIENQRANIGGDIDGEWRGFLTNADAALTTGEWHDLRLQANRSRIQFYVDDTLVGNLQDGLVGRGTVRILVPPQMRLRVADLRVVELTDVN